MQRRGCSNLGRGRPAARGTGNPSALQRLGRLLDLKRLDELIKEAWYSVCQFRVGHFGRVSLSDFESAPIDQISSVGGEKFVQHFYSLRAFEAPLCALAYTCRGANQQCRGDPAAERERTHALPAGFVPGPRRGFGSGGGSRRSLSFLTTA
jgi:hypothetical protein